MKIALYNLEDEIINVAMMQVSTYHKLKGDEVERYNHLKYEEYDKIYAFSIFTTTDKSLVRKKMICGGTGFDVNVGLPDGIGDCDYDWSLYPDCDHSIVWFSRGCIRNCSFCIVRKKEGIIHPVQPKNLNPRGKYIKVMDNNFFANPKWREAVKTLVEWNQPVDLQGVDIRIMNDEMISALKTLRFKRRLHIAWDNPTENLEPKLKYFSENFNPNYVMCYVLVGYNSSIEQDLYRVKTIAKYKILPYVMCYDKCERKNKVIDRLKNYVNGKIGVNVCEFEEYKRTEDINHLEKKHKNLSLYI